MRGSKTFIHDASFFSERHPPLNQEEQKGSLITHGYRYHHRLNASHGHLYQTILQERIEELNKKIDVKIEKFSEPLQKILQKIIKVDEKIAQLNAAIVNHNSSIAKHQHSNSARSKTILSNQMAKRKEKQNKLQEEIAKKNVLEMQRMEEKRTLRIRKTALKHEQTLNQSITLLKDGKIKDSVNFAIAEVVFVVNMKNSHTGTPTKKLAISFPIRMKGQNQVFNFRTIPETDDPFRTYCDVAQDNSYCVMDDHDLTLIGEGNHLDYLACDDKYFPQVAYHTEKFFFYYLTTQGIEDLVTRQFAKKSLSPNNLYSIEAMEIRMHSTRDMCRTCEPITIAEKHRIGEILNQLLIQLQYPPLPDHFKCFFIMSYNIKPRPGKIADNPLFIKSKSLPLAGGAASCAHTYTFFASGGESKDGKAEKEYKMHSECLETIQLDDEERWRQQERMAGLAILSAYRAYKHRKVAAAPLPPMSALSAIVLVGQTSNMNFVATTPHPPCGHLLPISGEKGERNNQNPVSGHEHSQYVKKKNRDLTLLNLGQSMPLKIVEEGEEDVLYDEPFTEYAVAVKPVVVLHATENVHFHPDYFKVEESCTLRSNEFSTLEDEDGCILVDKKTVPSLPQVAHNNPLISEEKKPPLSMKLVRSANTRGMFLQETRTNRQLGYNCFDVAVGLSRDELVQYALAHKHVLEYRQLLAQEIKTAAMITATLMNMESDQSTNKPISLTKAGSIALVEAFDLLDTAQKYGTSEDIQRLSLQIQDQMGLNEKANPLGDLKKLALPSAMHTKALQRLVNLYNVANDAIKPMLAYCNELLGYKEGKRLNVEELRTFFSNPVHSVEQSEALSQFNQALKSLKPHEEALQTYCQSEMVYVDYVKQHYGQKQWLAFIPNSSGTYCSSMVDIAARCLDKQIIIYQLQANEYKEQYRTAFRGKGKLFMEFTGNHFLALKSNPDYVKGLKAELASHGLFKPQASGASRSLDDPADIVCEYLGVD